MIIVYIGVVCFVFVFLVFEKLLAVVSCFKIDAVEVVVVSQHLFHLFWHSSCQVFKNEQDGNQSLLAINHLPAIYFFVEAVCPFGSFHRYRLQVVEWMKVFLQCLIFQYIVEQIGYLLFLPSVASLIMRDIEVLVQKFHNWSYCWILRSNQSFSPSSAP